MTAYIALMRKEARSDYSVDFPDFPGCVTAGRTLDEARVMAAEALQFHIDGMIADGEDIPDPAPLDAIHRHGETTDAVAFLVAVTTPKTKARRINVTLPEDTLRALDDFAKKRGYTRSGFIAHAVRRVIEEDAA